MAPDKTHLVQTKMVEGRSCIVIEVSEHVEINGISVKPIRYSRTGKCDDLAYFFRFLHIMEQVVQTIRICRDEGENGYGTWS